MNHVQSLKFDLLNKIFFLETTFCGIELFDQSSQLLINGRLGKEDIIIIMDTFRQLFDIAPSTISVHFCLSWAISLAFSKVRLGG